MQRFRRFATTSLLLALTIPACTGRAAQQTASTDFAQLVVELSEPGGYFDTDNLISNETSYLHVIDRLEALGVHGGAYIGVGPDQNFSYIAAIRPTIAFLVDVRRDNMLQHLLFKALFALSETRVEYLSLLFGRPPPSDAAAWGNRDVEALVRYVDETPASAASTGAARRVVDEQIGQFSIVLSSEDSATIDRFHRTFMDAGLGLRFRTHGRAARYYYPTYRDLLLERTRSGRRASYLASRTAYRTVKSLQDRGLVIPVVGDLAGEHAIAAIAEYLEESGEIVSAYYTSNVEFYLFRNQVFDEFARNVRALPIDRESVIIRSVFHGTFGPHPLAVPGYASTQVLQRIADMANGRFTTYWDVVTARAMN